MSKRREVSAFAWLLEPVPAIAAVGEQVAGDADEQDEALLMQAVLAARKGVGRTAPNPPVGAVLSRNGTIVGRGTHRRAGAAHAEVAAFSNAKGVLEPGLTLHVTLEPCNHQGRTPPCTERIIAEGVSRVVVGVRDPNPIVRGKGLARLRRAGISVEVRSRGPASDDCRSLIAPFAQTCVGARPFIVVKVASTLDGRVAAHGGHARWITGKAARRLVHRLRDHVDAVMVGSGTVLADDPALTVRAVGRRPVIHPRRVVIDGALRAPASAQIYLHQHGDRYAPVVFAGKGYNKTGRQELRAQGVDVEVGKTRRVDLKAAFFSLRERGVQSVLVEPGPGLLNALVQSSLIDEVWWMVAPTLLGADGVPAFARRGARQMEDAFDLRPLRPPMMLGADQLIVAGPPRLRGAMPD